MNRTQLAAKACMTHQNVGAIISGKQDMLSHTACQIARVLDVRLDWLLEGTGPMERAK